MSEFTDTLRAVFADHPADVADGFPAKLWATLDELGVTRLTLPESAGGSGGELGDAAALLLAAGEAAAPVPLAEADLLAGWLLHTASLPVPADGPTAVAVPAAGSVSLSGGGVSGELGRVPWARHATRIVVLADRRVLSVDRSAPGVTITEGVNVAGEPRDRVALRDVEAEAGQVAEGTAELLARRAALARALLLAGAASGALRQSVRYAGEREQFGRPIGRFQAVQQQLALAAAEVAAARAAVDAAVHIASADWSSDDAALAVAVAKARTGEAAGVVATIAHQVHGAIGFTQEHSLRHVTTRLWAWRDEDGDEAHWNAEVARRALAAGADGLWPLLTRGS